MSPQRSTPYFVCPNCQFAARKGTIPAWSTCPRCRARGERIELLVRKGLRAGEGRTGASG